MAASTQRRRIVRVLRFLRVAFRWCRIAVWMVILVAVAAVAYLHFAGLPDFVKKPLLQELHNRGIDAQFSRIRLGWSHEVIIKDVTFGRADDPLSPSLSSASAEVKLNFPALLRREFKIDYFSLFQGNIRVPVSETNTPPISLQEMNLRLRFLPGDCVELENARGRFYDIDLQFQGVLTNFSAISDWQTKTPSLPATKPQNWQESLLQFAKIANQVKFTAPPALYGKISGDAREPNTLVANLQLTAPGAKTPWGEMANLKLVANCSKIIDPGSQPFARLRISADRVATAWGGGEKIELQMTLNRSPLDWNLMEGAAEFNAANPRAAWSEGAKNWIRGAGLQWSGQVRFSASDFTLDSARGNLRAQEVESTWGSVKNVDAAVNTSRTNHPPKADAAWGKWAAFEPYLIGWQAEGLGIKSPGVELQRVQCSAQWAAPELVIDHLEAALYKGQLHASAHLDVVSRELRVTNSSDFDPLPLIPVLGDDISDLLTQFAWKQPPHIQNAGRLTLPPWTGLPSGWEDAVLRSLELSGAVLATNAEYRGIPLDSGKVIYTYTNQTWNLPRLHAVRADGDFYMDLISSDETHDYELVLDTKLDPRVLAIYLDWLPRRDYWLGQFQYSKPPPIHTEVRGNWQNPNALRVKAQLEASDFSFFAQPVSSLKASLAYGTNVLDITGFRFVQDAKKLETPLVRADFNQHKITITNLASTLKTDWLQRLLGTNLPSFFDDLGFEKPPSIQANGTFSISEAKGANLHFQIDGERFHWQRLYADTISGNIDWVGPLVRLSNVQAGLYGGGKGTGWVVFDASSAVGTDIRLEGAISNVELSQAVLGLTGKNLNIEGKLAATAALHGNSENQKSWQGTGAAEVRDALLWNIELFGIFSRMINEVVTDAGNTRAREAAGTFIITNGVLRTDDLQIRAATYRLLYRGTIDPREIDARVEVRILRDTPLLGPILTLALTPLAKVFEYQITGAPEHPVAEPVYLPGFLSHPIHTLKSILPAASGPTNGAPAPAEKK